MSQNGQVVNLITAVVKNIVLRSNGLTLSDGSTMTAIWLSLLCVKKQKVSKAKDASLPYWACFGIYGWNEIKILPNYLIGVKTHV